jgi:pimeloyl-ACP methyl ester carboxylesterase
MSVPVSKELFAPVAPDVQLCYQTFGSSDGEPLLLVMGLGGPMNWWDPELCTMLAEAGFHVVRFDNRDTGRSSRLKGRVSRNQLVRSFLGRGGRPPYTLDDMADDAFGLMDHLGWESAHIVGVSMGGMIVQTMAIEHADRLLSVTSIMSTIGDPAYGGASPQAMEVLLRPPAADRDAVIAESADFAVWASKKYFDVDTVLELAAASYDRSFYPEGAPRQLAAIFASGDRSQALTNVELPFLVVHGLDDTLIDPSGGRRTAELVPGAHLLLVADMGHDLPEPLWPLITSAIVGVGDTTSTTEVTGSAVAS